MDKPYDNVVNSIQLDHNMSGVLKYNGEFMNKPDVIYIIKTTYVEYLPSDIVV